LQANAVSKTSKSGRLTVTKSPHNLAFFNAHAVCSPSTQRV
jgi:hypothetical protein